MNIPFRLRRRPAVEPLAPGDFDEQFRLQVNARRRADDLTAAVQHLYLSDSLLRSLWLLRRPLALLLVVPCSLLVFAFWLVRH